MDSSHSYISKKGILIFAVLTGCVLSIIGCSVYLEYFFSLKREKFFYTPPLRYLELISGSFKSFFADIFYIRGVLALTDDIQGRNFRVDWVQKNFNIAVSLDPGLIQSYFFAGIVIARNKYSIEKGIEFLKKGLRLNPSRWQIPYWIGFDYYQSGGYLKAIEYYKKAAGLPGAPKFLKSVQAMLYYKAGRADLGAVYLKGLSRSVRDKKQMEWIKTKLKWLKNIVVLERKVKEFKAQYGVPPSNLNNLVEKGLINHIPRDPFGGGYYLDKKSGKVKSRFGPGR